MGDNSFRNVFASSEPRLSVTMFKFFVPSTILVKFSLMSRCGNCGAFDKSTENFPREPKEFDGDNYEIIAWIPPYDFYDSNDPFWENYKGN